MLQDFTTTLLLDTDKLIWPATNEPELRTALLEVEYGFLSFRVFTAPLTAFVASAGQFSLPTNVLSPKLHFCISAEIYLTVWAWIVLVDETFAAPV